LGNYNFAARRGMLKSREKGKELKKAKVASPERGRTTRRPANQTMARGKRDPPSLKIGLGNGGKEERNLSLQKGGDRVSWE